MRSTLKKLVEVDVGVIPSPSMSALTVIASDASTALLFNAVRWVSDEQLEDAGVGIYTFAGACRHAYGWPNDEAARAHPWLGGGSYGIYEVIESPWEAWVDEQNRHAFPGLRPASSMRHFFVMGHDEGFNCLASGVTAELVEEDAVSAWSRAFEIVRTRMLER